MDVAASVDLTWGINKELPNFISIYGTNGTLHIGWRESKYKLNSSPDWNVFGTGYDKVQAFKAKIENFRNAILNGEELLNKTRRRSRLRRSHRSGIQITQPKPLAKSRRKSRNGEELATNEHEKNTK